MIWYLQQDGISDDKGRVVDIDPLDGDWNKVGPQDLSIDIGKSKVSRVNAWQSGRHLDTTFMPTRLQVTLLRGRKDRPAFYTDYYDWGATTTGL